MNREKQGQQAHETSVPRKGRTNACHLPGTSDVLLWGIAHQQTTLYVSPFDRGRRERHGMLDA